ncbi:helix-turn-helix transcriptional regulator [Lentzea sp. NBRC 102530]|uniref:helix-turn-helix domain-containing protein n=1 Tax=Lentzea sp. NBRC 102530 TaxID=3032201 RepID=UPI002555E039|nr:helix-turn-helix transcriptional regulator [Lentzea sp. NBRC 102530]
MRISTVRGREFGAELRRVLAAAGLTSRQAAGILEWDEAKVSNLANGKGGASQLEVALLLGVCGVKSDEVARLLSLYCEKNQQGWWRQHGARSSAGLRTVVEHLKVAKTMTCWHTHMVPHFLQTARYMREVLSASSPASSHELDQRADTQLAMQAFIQQGTKCTFVIHELALRLPVGGPQVHAEQLLSLMSSANRPNVEIRILPAECGAHAGMAGPFTRLTFDKYKPLVWVETENSSLFAETDDAIRDYERVVDALEENSLDGDTSRQLVVALYDAL